MKVRQPLTIREAYVEASSFLLEHAVQEAAGCAELLLQHVFGWSRSELLLRWNEMFPVEHIALWQQLLARKAAGEPVQYIIGEQEFYGLPFTVNPAVLIPRPETELLVEQVVLLGKRLWPEAVGSRAAAVAGSGVARNDSGQKRQVNAAESSRAAGLGCGAVLAADEQAEQGPGAGNMPGAAGTGRGIPAEGYGKVAEPWREARQTGGHDAGRDGVGADGADEQSTEATGPLIADIGAGSGAIAVSLAVQCPQWRIVSSDISPAALAVAGANAERHGVGDRVAFLEGDLLTPYIERGLRLDAVVSNPPYIPEADEPGLQPEVRLHEPRTALYGGADGLALYRRLAAQLKELAVMPALVGLEVGLGQAEEVAGLLRAAAVWDEIRIVPDLAGIDRHVIAVRYAPKITI